MPPETRPLLTVKQVAQRLGLSRSHVYDTVITPRLVPLIRFGRTVRVRPEDLDHLIERLARQDVRL